MSDTQHREIPIACNLDSNAQAERQQQFAERLFAHAESKSELDDGYAYRFPGDPELLEQLAEYVLFDRQCCPFFTFELFFDPEQGPVTLNLRGPEGTKQFVERAFG